MTLPRMSRTPAQRGPFGNWLKESREARYPTQAKALEEMRRLAGLAIAPSEYAQWEAGSRVPRPDNPKVVGLIAFFGGDPFAADKESPADATPAGLSIAEAIDRQTAVLTTLLDRLVDDLAQREQRVQDLETLVYALIGHVSQDGAMPTASLEQALLDRIGAGSEART